jgi:hypothetical protein
VERELERFLFELGERALSHERIKFVYMMSPEKAAEMHELFPHGEVPPVRIEVFPKESVVMDLMSNRMIWGIKHPLLTEEDLETIYKKTFGLNIRALVMAHPNVGEAFSLEVLKKSRSVITLFSIGLNSSVNEEIREAALTKGLSIAEKSGQSVAEIFYKAIYFSLFVPGFKDGRVVAKAFDILKPEWSKNFIRPAVLQPWKENLRRAAPIPAKYWNETIGKGTLLDLVAPYFGFPERGERKEFFVERGKKIGARLLISYGDAEFAEFHLRNSPRDSLVPLAKIMVGEPAEIRNNEIAKIVVKDALGNPGGLRAITKGILKAKDKDLI